MSFVCILWTVLAVMLASRIGCALTPPPVLREEPSRPSLPAAGRADRVVRG